MTIYACDRCHSVVGSLADLYSLNFLKGDGNTIPANGSLCASCAQAAKTFAETGISALPGSTVVSESTVT